jgi:uncharacterized protein (TIGR03435 family)
MISWIDVAGWTLLHFVWQGSIIALMAALTLHVLRAARPQLRYVVACIALGLMLAAPLITAALLTSAPRMPIAESSAWSPASAGLPLHLLRSARGSVVGVAFTSPWSAQGPSAGGAAPAVTEVKLPAPVDTDTLFSVLVTFWLAGVTLLLARLTAGCWRLRQLHGVARLEEPSRWQVVAEGIAARLGLQRRFSVVESARLATPTVIGWLQPIVLLPIAAMAGLSPRQIEAILAHELAHIRRHDFIVNFLQTLAETVLFYHPAVWWMSARIRTEREHCCDDVAVAISGDAAEYAAALAELAAWSVSNPSLAMAATHGPLVDRVRRLLRVPHSDRRPGRTTFAVAAALTAFVILGAAGTILRAQPILEEGERFGPPQVNRLLGFHLFPGPVQLPGADPIGARAWAVTVGSGERQLSILGHSARAIIRTAYGLDRMPLVGGPRWMDEEAFEIAVPAALPIAGGLAESEEVQTALQTMLEGDLGLITHRETRDFPVYALVPARADGRLGPSLKPSTIDCFAGGSNPRPNADPATLGPVMRARVQARPFCGIEDSFFGLSGTGVTLPELAREFHRRHYPLSPDREIVDRTGLTGAYDFELRFGLIPLAAIGHANYRIGRVLEPFGIRSLATALPEQLGLKLVNATVSREVLVIDRINRP